MSISAKNSPKEFDRSVCFTCFAPWVETVRLMAQDSPETALRAFLTLADYCLYGAEPDPVENAWGAMWPIVEGEAKRSIANRRRGFGSENIEQTNAIKAYILDHPEATQREVANFVGCSLWKVNKVLRTPEAPAEFVCTDNGTSISSLSLQPPEQNECEVFGFPLCEEVEA